MKKIKIIAHSDGHGICVGVSALRRLTRKGHQVNFYCQHPQTHPKVFWRDTLRNLDLRGYDNVLILDIPFDRDFKEACIEQLLKLSQKVPISYIDHHDSTEPYAAPNLNIDKRDSPSDCYYVTEDRLTFLGAVCDRDVTIANRITPEDITIAEGIDWAIKKEAENIGQERIISKLAEEDFDFFKAYYGQIPLPRSCRIGKVTIVDTSTPKMSNLIFKSLEKAVEVQQTPYGLGLTRETKLHESPDKVDVLTMIKYWQDISHPSIKEVISNTEHPIIQKYKERCYLGAENNLSIKLNPDARQMAEAASAIIELFSDYDYSGFIGKRIVIGGPPNSGKSSFMFSLSAALKDMFGVEATAVDLDLMSPTGEFIEGKISKEQRDKQKKPCWTPDLAKEAKRLFLDAEGDIILGDTPGKIDEITEFIIEPADSAFIVSRDAKAFLKWRRFFESRGIRVIGEFISALDAPTEHLSNEGRHLASFLNRCLYPYNPIILTLALFLVSNLS